MKYLHPSNVILFVVFAFINQVSVLAQRSNPSEIIPPPKIDKSFISSNQNDRELFLIFHFTAGGMGTSFEILMGRTLRSVSSHFLINDTPSIFFPEYIYNLVPEENRAWHAGLSNWGVHSSLNSSSIGVEIVNIDGNMYEYSEKQLEHIIDLGKYLVAKYKIAPELVLGHSDIAPSRKNDPGILFPWKALYDNGVGAWPDSVVIQELKSKIFEVPSVTTYQQELIKYGYKILKQGIINSETINVISAFQRHFRPRLVDGNMDLESYIILLALNQKYKKI